MSRGAGLAAEPDPVPRSQGAAASTFLDDAAVTAGHVATALARHRKWWLGLGRSLPPWFDGVLALASAFARQRQAATNVDELAALHDVLHMPPPQLLPYVAAAHVLAVSPRQVDRLVANGSLPAVRVGGAARIRVADLDRYVAALTPHNTNEEAS